MGARVYKVNIVGLANKAHHFDFEMGNDFFERYGSGLITEGSLLADVTLDKHETFIESARSRVTSDPGRSLLQVLSSSSG